MSFLSDLQKVSNNISIIYAEDDIVLQEKTSLLLDNFINRSIVCSNGIEALNSYIEYYEKNEKYIDIVITDIQMPKKNGIELIKDILKLNPKQSIIVISAHDDSKYLIELINLGVSHFILKPFQGKQFLQTLYDCCSKINDIEDKVSNDFSYKWDKINKVLTYNNKIIELSKNEILILDVLFLVPGQIFSHDMIFDIINDYKELSIDSIKSTLKRLRKKLPQELIQNVYAQGYKVNLV